MATKMVISMNMKESSVSQLTEIKALAFYPSSVHRATVAFIWSLVSGHLANISSIHSLFALFWFPPTPIKISVSSAAICPPMFASCC